MREWRSCQHQARDLAGASTLATLLGILTELPWSVVTVLGLSALFPFAGELVGWNERATAPTARTLSDE
jgi:hypothetical protein